VLGLSLSKILFTILIIVAIWKGFMLLNRLANQRRASVKKGAAKPAQRDAAAQPAGTIELRECPRCGAYVDPREGCRCGERRNEARRAGS
jgi:hypothetical protein